MCCKTNIHGVVSCTPKRGYMESDVLCLMCDGAGIVQNRLCGNCNGHGVVRYIPSNSSTHIATYSPTLEQQRAKALLGEFTDETRRFT